MTLLQSEEPALRDIGARIVACHLFDEGPQTTMRSGWKRRRSAPGLSVCARRGFQRLKSLTDAP
jgi:hypothetical protein